MSEFMTEELKEWPIERKKLAELTPASYNPRVIGIAQKAGLSASLEKFGIVQPIVWNKRSGNIVGGHQRYKVLQDSGIEETDVVVVDLPHQEEVALNITLNNPEIRGDFTEETLEQLNMVSDSIKEEFSDLGFTDLREELKNRFEGTTEKVHKVDKTKTQKKKNKEVVPDDKILIDCPKCNACFRKSDKKILFQEEE